MVGSPLSGPSRLDGQTALITGAAGGIGRAVVAAFCEAGLECFGQPLDCKHFFAREFQRCGIFARLELQRQDAHADEIRAMNALVALRNDGPHAEQFDAFGCPVAR